jgi:SAM-dependent methyltransferase
MEVIHKNTPSLKQNQLLVYGDFGCASGFAKVTKELVDNWKKDETLNIVVLAINDKSPEVYDYAKNVKVFPADILNKENPDVYKRMEFLSMLYHNDFDTVFCLNDIEVFLNVNLVLKMHRF